MGSLKRKLIIGFSALGLTGLCAVTITYAWFARNNVAWVDEFDYNVKSSQGLLISTDGTNFKQDIPTSEIKKIIEDWSGEEYSNVNYYMSSLGSYDNGDYVIGDDLYPNMYVDETYKLDTPNGDIEYGHRSASATSKDYLSFDLWLRYMDTSNTEIDSKLWFSNDTKLESKDGETEVKLSNKLTTKEDTYSAGDTLKVNPVDAMRIFVSVKDDKMTEASGILYETSTGLGSAAIEGSTEENYNKDTNAMYTYYNELQPLKAFTQAATSGSAYLNTVSSFTENEFYTFKYDSTYTNPGSDLHYRDVHLVVTIFMEGWDADYFLGIPYAASSFKVNLSFTVNDPNNPEEE